MLDVTTVQSVINEIDKNINSEDDWKFFEDAFNNADKDFLKRIKTKHEGLTNNDLRLCAYLRLNLSSKEIAPLLNISVKSVEMKRYRLRKKFELPHERKPYRLHFKFLATLLSRNPTLHSFKKTLHNLYISSNLSIFNSMLS